MVGTTQLTIGYEEAEITEDIFGIGLRFDEDEANTDKALAAI